MFIIILEVFTFSSICFAMMTSFIFSNPQSAYSRSRYMIGVGSFLIPSVLYAFIGTRFFNLAAKVEVLFSYTPLYALYYTLTELMYESFPQMKILSQFTVTERRSIYITSTNAGLRCLVLSGVISIVGLFLFETCSSWIMRCREKHRISKFQSDVRTGAIKKKESKKEQEETIKCQYLSKVYSDGVEALRDVTFDVESGIIFGIYRIIQNNAYCLFYL